MQQVLTIAIKQRSKVANSKGLQAVCGRCNPFQQVSKCEMHTKMHQKVITMFQQIQNANEVKYHEFTVVDGRYYITKGWERVHSQVAELPVVENEFDDFMEQVATGVYTTIGIILDECKFEDKKVDGGGGGEFINCLDCDKVVEINYVNSQCGHCGAKYDASGEYIYDTHAGGGGDCACEYACENDNDAEFEKIALGASRLLATIFSGC